MSAEAPQFSRTYLRYALAILLLANLVNYMDRMIMSVVMEQVKHEFALSDTQVGLLAGFAFSLLYGTMGVFIARLADRHNRIRIIAVSMLVWSVITSVTGAVQNFWQLFVARIGVGIGEAGVIPVANALIADYFSRARRSAALAVFSAGATLGMMSGLALGGWAAGIYGWRWAFVIAGIPGVPLAVLVWKTLREPPRGMSDGAVVPSGPPAPLFETLRTLLTIKTYVHIVIAACFVNFIRFGVVQWMPTFIIRRFELEVAQVGLFFGTALGLGSAAGTVLGGIVASHLAQRDIRWLIRIPFITGFFYLPLYELALFSPNAYVTLAFVFAVSMIGCFSFGPMLAVMQSIVPPSMRATAAAFYGFWAMLIGVGGAPFMVGVMSDFLAPSMGTARSLQWALAISMIVTVMIVIHFRRAMDFFARDMDAQAQPIPAAS